MNTPFLPPAGVPVKLNGRTFPAEHPVVMAIINRTTDSFFPGARQLDDDVAQEAVAKAEAEGADIVDIGGIKAAPGDEIGAAEEIDRVVPFIEYVSKYHPGLVISVDTWRADVADAAVDAGAHILNDTWAGHDPELINVAGRRNVAVVCSHTGGAQPRTRPHRVRYGSHPDGVVDDVVDTLKRSAERAVAAGVDPQSVLIDPTHDFGKNTWHGIALLRHTEKLAALGYPVLMALSRKDFVGESLDLPVTERLYGTLGATAIAAWMGARVVRCHDVAATRQLLDMVAVIRGDRQPRRVTRGLA